MNLFSKNLRFLRKKGNHNQHEISILFHKRANTIGNWENQKSEPSLSELMKLADYFKVSTEALLLADLEKEDFSYTEQKQDPESTTPVLKSYPVPEPVSSLAQEGNPDAFWLILRELRAVNDKLDLLTAGVQSAAFILSSDKSSH